jgi:polyferredoxin
VQVCPTGIDIRDGLQYECISCAACIDACDEVMDKVGYPRGLIRYSTERALEQGWGKREIWRRVLRPRVLIYSAALATLIVAFAASLGCARPSRSTSCATAPRWRASSRAARSRTSTACRS